MGKHAAILIGIAAMRASLVGTSKDQEHNAELQRIGFTAIKEVDPTILNDKPGFYKALLEQKPMSVVDVLDVIDSFGKFSKGSA